MMIAYVHDTVVTGNDYKEIIKNFQIYLGTKFEIKDLRTLERFLGNKVVRPEEGIIISHLLWIFSKQEN